MWREFALVPCGALTWQAATSGARRGAAQESRGGLAVGAARCDKAAAAVLIPVMPQAFDNFVAAGPAG